MQIYGINFISDWKSLLAAGKFRIQKAELMKLSTPNVVSRRPTLNIAYLFITYPLIRAYNLPFYIYSSNWSCSDIDDFCWIANEGANQSTHRLAIFITSGKSCANKAFSEPKKRIKQTIFFWSRLDFLANVIFSCSWLQRSRILVEKMHVF